MNRKTTMIGTALLWALGCLAHYYFRTAGMLRGPHEGDLYAFSWGFQALNFAVFPLPVWLIVLGIAILSEREYFNRKEKERLPEQSNQPDRE